LQQISNIAIVGSGNAAYHFAAAFQQLHDVTVTVYARSEEKRIALANATNATTGLLHNLSSAQHDAVLLAVTDQSIQTVSELAPKNTLVLHCSGATALSVIKQEHAGVLYPLQTMTKSKAVDFSAVPILIESNSEQHKPRLEHLAKRISEKVLWMTSEKRLKVHLAAVFACNFSNFMMASAQRFLAKEQIPFELLHTLIAETSTKAMAIGPEAAQTGPALRGDKNVLSLHETMLEEDPELLHIYQIISNLIQSQHGIV
jgi:predicted short-subunit dehydrogenase-like oxidoreductase (DUF2520 family)